MDSGDPSSGCIACKSCNGESGHACICCTTCNIASLHSSSSLWWSWVDSASSSTSPQLDSPSSCLQQGSSQGLCTWLGHSKWRAWQWCHSPPASPYAQRPWCDHSPGLAPHPAVVAGCSAERHRWSKGTRWCPTCRELAPTSRDRCGMASLPRPKSWHCSAWGGRHGGRHNQSCFIRGACEAPRRVTRAWATLDGQTLDTKYRNAQMGNRTQ